MTYALGIDLGTTFSTAAVARADAVELVELGSNRAAVPSVVVLREDGSFLTGDAAERRAASAPERVAREFKRRLGDTTPMILGGAPTSAEMLTAQLLRDVVGEVVRREGGPPERVVLTHPANWGEFRTELFRQAADMADVGSVDLLSEPEAAAIHYAAQERVADGSVIVVYDLGGGTFDAAVLQKTEGRFELLGKPAGIEHLGGLDFDAAVFAHVLAETPELRQLDPDDATSAPAVRRLRMDCVEAKETLSSDTDVVIPVLLPTYQGEVQLTRRGFEDAIRPSITATIDSLRRALADANVEPHAVDRVLLIGGSSRIPVIASTVAGALGRPVSLDSHPKNAVALGAARVAAGVILSSPPDPPADPAPVPVAAEAPPVLPVEPPQPLHDDAVATEDTEPVPAPAARPLLDPSTTTELPTLEVDRRPRGVRRSVALAALVIVLSGLIAAALIWLL